MFRSAAEGRRGSLRGSQLEAATALPLSFFSSGHRRLTPQVADSLAAVLQPNSRLRRKLCVKQGLHGGYRIYTA